MNIVQWVADRLPAETWELHSHWWRDPAELDMALRTMRAAGVFRCTDGLWWHRDSFVIAVWG